MKTFHGIEANSAEEAFLISSGNGNLKAMKLLLESGTNIDTKLGEFNSTALTTAAYLNLKTVTTFLIQNGANMNLSGGGNNMTPLMLACSNGKSKGSAIALMLIQAGANVNHVRESDLMTALKFAVKRAKPEVVQALIDAGADIDGPKGSKLTALMLAARHDNVDALKTLIENGANPSIQSKLKWADGYTALDLAKLEKCKKAELYLSTI